VTGSNALGEYLRARRGLVDPADAGLRVAGVRRTPGLRREEVATLADAHEAAAREAAAREAAAHEAGTAETPASEFGPTR
jgi:hypothetical protein